MLFVNLATKSPPHHSFRKSLLPTLLLPPVECKQNKIKQLAKFKTHKKWKLFWVIVLWIINEISVTLVMWEPYHKNDWEEDTRHKHDWKTVNEPWAPVDTISKPHHSHGFLEPEIWTLMLLILQKQYQSRTTLDQDSLRTCLSKSEKPN